MNKQGILITFEGPEGSGKSTQIGKLAQDLHAHGLDVLALREPGGTKISDQFRVIPHDLANEGISPWAEAFAYQGARAQLYHEIIAPQLALGRIVLCDRSGDSTIAYQGYARGLGCGRLDQLNQISTLGIVPDLTLFLDIPVEVGIQRRRRGDGEWNRMDAQTLEFHEQVREAYLALYSYDEQNRWRCVDATRGIEEVYADVMQIVESELTSRGFMERIGMGKERR